MVRTMTHRLHNCCIWWNVSNLVHMNLSACHLQRWAIFHGTCFCQYGSMQSASLVRIGRSIILLSSGRGNMKEKLSWLCRLLQNSSLIILKCAVKIFSTGNSPCHILYLLKALLCVCLTMARQLYKCWTMFASKTMPGEVAAMSTLN